MYVVERIYDRRFSYSVSCTSIFMEYREGLDIGNRCVGYLVLLQALGPFYWFGSNGLE